MRGANVGLIARGMDGLRAAVTEVESSGSRAIAAPADVADPDAVEGAARKIQETFGRIDIWINNAMCSVFARSVDVTPAEFERVTHVTYLGTVYGTQAALRRMIPRNSGIIAQVGSALAFRGIPLQPAYCAAKHAVQGFTESLRTELLHDRIDVHMCMVHLPAVNTPQFEWVKSKLEHRAQPVPPIFEPELIAEGILWAIERRKRELLIGLPTWKAVWGNRFFPGIVDRVLAKRGFDLQQTEEPEDPNRPHNLWEPVPGDHGARGRFDARSKDASAQLWLTMNKGVVGAALVATLGAAVLFRLASRR
jgi:short-subunit dehydrogenase